MEPKAPCARCEKCPLQRMKFAPTYVPENNNGVMVIGEAPGAQEARKGIPFVGPSGELLEHEYRRLGGKWEEAIRTNAVLCWPPENDKGARTPLDAAIAACAPRLRHEIESLKPNNIITLGKTPARIVSVLAGQGVEEGIVIEPERWPGVTVTGTPHPSYILRRNSELPRFQRALRRAMGMEAPDSIEALLKNEPEVIVLRTFSGLMEVLNGIADKTWVSFDIETNNLNWYDKPYLNGGTAADTILCLAFTTGVGYGWIVTDELLYDIPGARDALSAFFGRVQTIAHNGKFDTIFLRANGFDSHVDVDTLAAHYGLDETPGTHGLKELASAFFGIPDYEGKLIKPYLKSKNDDYSKIPEEPLFKYAIWDVCATIALAQKFKIMLKRQDMWEKPFQSLYMPALKMLTEIEWNGIMVDIPSIQQWKERFHSRADLVKKKLADIAGNDKFNPGSSLQCQKLLFEDLGLPITKSAVTGRAANSQAKFKDGSTSRVVLEAQLKGAHPAVDMIIEYRQLEHKISSYFDNMLENADVNHRLHTQYLLHGTESGRISARNPALQTIPRATTLEGRIIRSCFIASPGMVFVDCDYSQAELRVFAALTLDPFLLKVYEDDRDLHNEVVEAMYGPKEDQDPYVYIERRMSIKMFNFGWAFGAGLARAMQILPDPVAAREFYKLYEAQMPVAAEWRKNQASLADHQGQVVSRTGRKRRFPDTGYGPEAINAPVQSGASDCTLKAAERLMTEHHRVLLLVHDSTVTEVPEKQGNEKLEYIPEVMAEEAAKLFPEVKWKADGKLSYRWAKQLTDQEVKDWMETGGLSEADDVISLEGVLV